jgi:hypothetical protein
MIRSLSPYYITIPFVSVQTGLTCTDYTLSITVWSGLKASVPATPTYTFTKTNPTASTGNDYINISRIIADQIEFAHVSGTSTGFVNGGNTLWVNWEYIYTTTDEDDTDIPQGVGTTHFSLGYSYGNEGQNYTDVTNYLLFQGDEFNVNRGGFYCLPFLMNESTGSTATIISYPDNEINVAIASLATTNSTSLVQYLWVNVSETTTDDYIVITFNGNEVATLVIKDECKYTPVDIFFQNKDGFQQSITFFKEQTSSLDVMDNEFESDRGQPLDGYHQFVRFNVQGKSKFKANSGWVNEAMNETFKQLLFSERVWKYDGTNFIPLNIKSKSQSWKTQQKDKLINYELEFEYSYNEINNI